MTRGKSRQISFREKEDLYRRVEDSARDEDLAIADFVRKVFRVGFREYEAHGSLHAVRIRADAVENALRAVDLDREAQAKVRRSLAKDDVKKRAKAG